MKKEKVRFYVEKQSKLVQSAVVLMILSAVFRIMGCWSGFSDSFFAVTQIALPLSCNLLFILILMTAGKRFFSFTSVPMVLGVLFLIVKATECENWLHMILVILLGILMALGYCATVYGVIPTKWPLLPLFLLPFVYQAFLGIPEDLGSMSFAAGMQEMSVLCIVLALLCISLAMKKKKPAPIEEQELPKIKDPKPFLNENTQSAETAVCAETAEENAPAEESVPVEENIPTEIL